MDNLHRQADNLLRKSRDLLDQPNSPAGKRITQQLQRLEDELQVKKNPKTIERTTLDLIRDLDNLSGDVMDHNDSEWLKRQIEQIRDQLRRM